MSRQSTMNPYRSMAAVTSRTRLLCGSFHRSSSNSGERMPTVSCSRRRLPLRGGILAMTCPAAGSHTITTGPTPGALTTRPSTMRTGNSSVMLPWWQANRQSGTPPPGLSILVRACFRHLRSCTHLVRGCAQHAFQLCMVKSRAVHSRTYPLSYCRSAPDCTGSNMHG